MRFPRRPGVALIALAVAHLAVPPLDAQAPTTAGLRQGIELYEAGNREEAKRHLESVAAGGVSPEAAYYLGLIALDTGDWDAAVKWLERAVSLAPNVSNYQMQLGRAYGQKAQVASRLAQPGLAGKARAAFTRAVELDPENLDARSGLVDFYVIAPRIMGGNKARALEHAREIKARDAYRGAYVVARVHAANDEPEQAIEELHGLMVAFPDSAAPVLRLALLHHERRDWPAAMQVLRPLAAASPPNWSAVYQVGRTGALSGDYLDEAERALRLYLAQEPGSVELSRTAAHWRLGMVLEHKGDRDGARAEYGAALRLDPDYDAAKKALGRLR
jgi:tetratricopeptide (TPR) repeat protein